ncbi:hypothetical protein GXM_05083 [Nostoc sphaeroides CCNUC1]|uniref:Uncharacterized protein n=1 Tax=Nostoc sphaeroides CCNUC1 TaxID=2653204 RepID=A0A5P8W506_9NOSO|nr:hypothetical protein GXM_05083 [Nostoc sphaeroides CCNUC1]
MNRQRLTVNNSNGIFFYLEVPNVKASLDRALLDCLVCLVFPRSQSLTGNAY